MNSCEYISLNYRSSHDVPFEIGSWCFVYALCYFEKDNYVNIQGILFFSFNTNY